MLTCAAVIDLDDGIVDYKFKANAEDYDVKVFSWTVREAHPYS